MARLLAVILNPISNVITRYELEKTRGSNNFSVNISEIRAGGQGVSSGPRNFTSKNEALTFFLISAAQKLMASNCSLCNWEDDGLGFSETSFYEGIRSVNSCVGVPNNPSIDRMPRARMDQALLSDIRAALDQISPYVNSDRGASALNQLSELHIEKNKPAKKSKDRSWMKVSASECSKLYGNKRPPRGKQHYLGIEIEFFAKAQRQELAARFIAAGLKKYVSVKRDGSIRPALGHHPHEINILLPQKELEKIIPKITKVLQDVESSVNDSCGLHVHLDMRHRPLKEREIYERLNYFQGMMYLMQPRNRYTNRYCRPSDDWDMEMEGCNRYKGINLTALDKFNTIEIRLSEGSIDHEFICQWTKMLCQIVDAKIKVDTKQEGVAFDGNQRIFNRIFEAVKFGPDQVNFINNRVAQNEKTYRRQSEFKNLIKLFAKPKKTAKPRAKVKAKAKRQKRLTVSR